jgi:hypothetical protein
MNRSTSTDYCGSFIDDDSGIGIDYSSSNDLNSSTLTLIEPSSSYSSQSRILPLPIPPATTIQKRLDVAPLIKFASDGVIERIRPSTMKNSENGDFVVCQTNRGTFVAYRTSIVPQWVTRLVQEVEYHQQ